MIAVLLLVVLSGCDSAAVQTDGLSLNVIDQAGVGWVVHRSDTGDSWDIEGSWHKKFRCYSDRCESTFLAEPAVEPPAGCRGWKKEVEEFRITNDYHRNETWELDEYDLQPIPRGCVGKSKLKKIRAKYSL